MLRFIRQALLRPDGTVRFGLRAAIFYLANVYIVYPLLAWPTARAAELFGIHPAFSAPTLALNGVRNLVAVLLFLGLFAAYERRQIDSYGVPLNRVLSRQTLEGALAAIFAAGSVALGMLALGGMHIEGLAVHGGAMVRSAVGWILALTLAASTEELLFRSYPLLTLRKSIGFWPAAWLIALVFAADHYFDKPGENIWDVIMLVSVSLMASDSLRRTGTLWFAIAFHATFNVMQIFVIGTPNGGRYPVGRLFNAEFTGPAWLTGGSLGTEASRLVYPAIALVWLYLIWRYPTEPSQPEKAGS